MFIYFLIRIFSYEFMIVEVLLIYLRNKYLINFIVCFKFFYLLDIK